MRKRFRRRAAIEPVISHLKHDFSALALLPEGPPRRSTHESSRLKLGKRLYEFGKVTREWLL